jgi:hypothetical protein
MIIRKNEPSFLLGEGETVEEAFGWLFVGPVPLLFEKRRVAKQFQIETWLDLAQVLKELNIKPESTSQQKSSPASAYIV